MNPVCPKSNNMNKILCKVYKCRTCGKDYIATYTAQCNCDYCAGRTNPMDDFDTMN